MARPRPAAPADDDGGRSPPREAEDWLDSVTWEVVRDEQGQIRRPVSVTDPATGAAVEGQAIVFRTKAPTASSSPRRSGWGRTSTAWRSSSSSRAPTRSARSSTTCSGRTASRSRASGTPARSATWSSASSIEERIEDSSTHSANDVAKAGDKPIDNTALPLRVRGRGEPVFRDPDRARPAADRPGRSLGQPDGRSGIAHRNEKTPCRNPTSASGSPRGRSRSPRTSRSSTPTGSSPAPRSADALRPYGAEGLAIVPQEPVDPASRPTSPATSSRRRWT